MADPSFDNLKALAQIRFRDAEILLQAERFSAAYYLSGYSIECGLKAVIARSFRAQVIPSPRFVNAIHTHNLGELISLSGLKTALDAAKTVDPQFDANWALVSGWKETSRYETIDPFTANGMLAAVGGPAAGVLQWLKKHW